MRTQDRVKPRSGLGVWRQRHCPHWRNRLRPRLGADGRGVCQRCCIESLVATMQHDQHNDQHSEFVVEDAVDLSLWLERINVTRFSCHPQS